MSAGDGDHDEIIARVNRYAGAASEVSCHCRCDRSGGWLTVHLDVFPLEVPPFWTGERTSRCWYRLLPLVTVAQRFVLGPRGRIDRYVRVGILPKGEKAFV